MSLSPDTSEATEKALIEAKREGFAHGRCCYAHELDLDEREKPCDQCVARAKKVYPIRVSRPRVVKDPYLTYEWSIRDGCLFLKCDNPWVRYGAADRHHAIVVDAKRVAVWSDLFASPLEEVDAE